MEPKKGKRNQYSEQISGLSLTYFNEFPALFFHILALVAFLVFFLNEMRNFFDIHFVMIFVYYDCC